MSVTSSERARKKRENYSIIKQPLNGEFVVTTFAADASVYNPVQVQLLLSSLGMSLVNFAFVQASDLQKHAGAHGTALPCVPAIQL